MFTPTACIEKLAPDERKTLTPRQELMHIANMIPTKPLNLVVQKWQTRAPAAAVDYARGVETTPKDWAALTAAAAPNYEAGVQLAIQAKRFEQGVRTAGTPKWKKATMEKGPDRWRQGIQLGGDNYSRGFAPFLDAIANATLPPRGPRGSEQNYERSREMGKILHAARVGGGA